MGHIPDLQSPLGDPRALLDALPEAITLVGPDDAVALANMAWEHLREGAGAPAGGGYTALYEAIFKPSQADLAALTSGIREVLEGSSPRFEMDCSTTIGQAERRFTISVGPYSSEPLRVALIQHRDITEITDLHRTLEPLRRWESVFDNAGWGIVIANPATNLLEAVNPACARMHGYTVEEMFGMPLGTMFAPESLAELPGHAAIAHERGRHVYESVHIRKDGSTFPVMTEVFAVKDTKGNVLYRSANFQDITAQKKAQADQQRLHDEVLTVQATTLAELSTPLIPITDDVMVIPLIGAMDTQRAARILETLLHGVSAHRTRIAIIDVTGVAMIDTHVANGLIVAARAVRLLGAHVVLTGVRPEVAQTLVAMGTDLTGIVTLGTLQSGIAYALGRDLSGS